MGLKNEFETAVVNKPSVFKPLKFYRVYVAEWSGLLVLDHSERFSSLTEGKMLSESKRHFTAKNPS